MSSLVQFIRNFDHLILDPMSGSGTLWINFARKNTNIGIIAIEKRFKRAVRFFEKASQSNLTNIFIIRGIFEDSFLILNHVKFNVIYIAFPDPWPKERWSKHRFYNYLDKFQKILKPGGKLILKTDNLQIAINTFKKLIERNFLILKLIFNYIEPLKSLRTDFEKLFIKKRSPIISLVAKNCSGFLK